MNILFIHQNFPGQFKHLAPALVRAGHQVVALVPVQKGPSLWEGVRLLSYEIKGGNTPGLHPWLVDIETKTLRGEALYRASIKLRAEGYRPDFVMAHPGWGESLFIKEVWPTVRLGLYCEFFYQVEGADAGFDPEFPPGDPGDACRLRLKNINNLLHMESADAGLSPTEWQASTFPQRFRERLAVIHDGIDTQRIAPNPGIQLTLNQDLILTRQDEVITFVSRNLEPYRGYHCFIRALPELMRRRPHARILIVGGDGVSYGARAPAGLTWRQRFLDEVRDQVDLRRIHFVGKLPYPTFLGLLQLSTVHVYLTYPFVLSWSLLEAMSAGCAIVASDTGPVREVIEHDRTGRRVGFFDTQGLADQIVELLDNPDLRQQLGGNARALILERYDLQRICLPQQLAWVETQQP